jgi:hypothetical protein
MLRFLFIARKRTWIELLLELDKDTGSTGRRWIISRVAEAMSLHCVRRILAGPGLAGEGGRARGKGQLCVAVCLSLEYVEMYGAIVSFV